MFDQKGAVKAEGFGARVRVVAGCRPSTGAEWYTEICSGDHMVNEVGITVARYPTRARAMAHAKALRAALRVAIDEVDGELRELPCRRCGVQS